MLCKTLLSVSFQTYKDRECEYWWETVRHMSVVTVIYLFILYWRFVTLLCMKSHHAVIFFSVAKYSVVKVLYSMCIGALLRQQENDLWTGQPIHAYISVHFGLWLLHWIYQDGTEHFLLQKIQFSREHLSGHKHLDLLVCMCWCGIQGNLKNNNK